MALCGMLHFWGRSSVVAMCVRGVVGCIVGGGGGREYAFRR